MPDELQLSINGVPLNISPVLTRQRQNHVSDMATPFGCCHFFDECADEIMSLHFGGNLSLLDWMGFNVSNECYRSVEYINYVRPEFDGRTPTTGNLPDVCAEPDGYQFGSCRLTTEDFGRYGRVGPIREIMKPMNWCKTSPRRRLDGTPVTSEAEWDMRMLMDTLIPDIARHLITGNSALNTNQFDGLERWVRTGYDCAMLDSTVVDWNGNGLGGGAGITWNGGAIAATFDFIDVLLDVFRRIRNRTMWSPVLQNQQPRVGDIILLMPTSFAHCFLNYFTCWSVCDGRQYNEVNLQSYEARKFRDSLQGGMFGAGEITLDGFTIPILPWDWETIKGPTLNDVYLLAGSWGGVRIWEGEHLDANIALRETGVGGWNDGQYFSTDGGRILWKWDAANLCKRLKGWMFPRLFCNAPWAQARFQDVRCDSPLGPLSPDPLATSFYPETSFTPASCPPGSA